MSAFTQLERSQIAGADDEISSAGRAREIALVLARHGLWHLVYAFGLKRFLPIHHPGRQPQGAAPRPAAPAELRRALEELGPTFMKLGQILATRSDLVSPAYQSELSSLQDDAPAIPAEEIARIVEEELGMPVAEAFASFELRPLATGSIGQAHLAILHDGTEVVVKVRRPDAVRLIEEDLRLLRELAKFANNHWDSARHYDLVSLVDQFDKSLHAELDYQVEGRNAERFATNFAGSTSVHVPRVFWATSTSRVLTLERMHGIKVTADDALLAAGIDRHALAQTAADIVLKMVFEDGFFHADLHPGNVFIESQDRIALIDFGMVGVLDDRLRAGLGALMVGVARSDADQVVDSLGALGVTGADVERAELRRDLQPLLEKYQSAPPQGQGLSPLLGDVMEVIRRHHLVLPGNLSLLFKTVASGEGTILKVDPSFQLIKAVLPYARRLILRLNSPQAWAGRLEQTAPDLAWLATDGPRVLRRFLTDLGAGPLKVDMKPAGFEPLVGRLERIGNRIVLGMVVSALIVALGVSASVYHPGSSVPGLEMLVTAGFAATSVLGAALAWSMFRATR
jgi:ubiquinone biosynthesis protein